MQGMIKDPFALDATTSFATLTYGFGGVSVVERVGASDSETVYMVGDHLGSASMAFQPDGTVVADVRYLPFGEER